MTRGELIWPWVEKTLAETIGPEQFSKIDDEVVVVRAGRTNVIIRMQEGDEPRLQVFCPILRGIDKTPELLDKLNEMNLVIPFAKAVFNEGELLVATELLAEGLEKEALTNAIGVVASATDHFEGDLKTAFGGELLQPEQPDQPDQTGAEAAEIGVGEGVGLAPGEEITPVPEPITAPSAKEAEPPKTPDPEPNKKDSDTAGYL